MIDFVEFEEDDRRGRVELPEFISFFERCSIIFKQQVGACRRQISRACACYQQL